MPKLWIAFGLVLLVSFTCSTCKAYSTDGDLLEGHPAAVKFPVEWTRADIAAELDSDLEAALKLIGERETLNSKQGGSATQNGKRSN